MSKKKFASPFLILAPIVPGEDDDVTGGGSAQSGFKPYPCSFDDWLKMFHTDYDEDGDFDRDDYRTWWIENQFSEDDWNKYNPPSTGGDGNNALIELHPEL